MKNLLLLLWSLLSFSIAKAQIANPGFENWTLTNYDEANTPWFTSNMDDVQQYAIATVTKVSGTTGFAPHLETKFLGTDTFAGAIVNGKGNPLQGQGGVPYILQATSFKGSYRYHVVAGDTAIIAAIFKRNGMVISSNFYKITGNQSTFTAFSFPVASMIIIPDSIIVAAVSSNLLTGNPVAGSWLEIDDLAGDNGTIVVPIQDGDFEGWTPTSFEGVNNWEFIDGLVQKTTDKNSGTYAAQLTSVDVGFGNIVGGEISQGVALNNTFDTLTGYYKYNTPGFDSGYVDLDLRSLTNVSLSHFKVTLPPVANYTMFKIPLTAATPPASMILSFSSSDPTFAVNNSTLYIDNLVIIPQFVSVPKVSLNKYISVYPNPVSDKLMVNTSKDFSGLISVNLSDMQGRSVLSSNYQMTSGNAISIPVAEFSQGVYFYSIKTIEGVTNGKFIKE